MFPKYISATWLKAAFLGASVMASGCAKEPEAAPVAPVKVQVTASDFCAIVKRAYGPDGPTYDLNDTMRTFTGNRRLAASFRAKRCNPVPATS